MNDTQWQALRAVIRGEKVTPLPVAFIIDSPWLPNWAGMTILDYYTSEERWLAAQPQGHRGFPGVHLSARLLVRVRDVHRTVGVRAKCLFYDNEFPSRRSSSRARTTLSGSPSPIPAATACCRSSSSA